MIGMIDKETAQHQAEGGRALAHWLSRSTQEIGQAFRVLQRIQYDRPWGAGARYYENLRDAGPAAYR